MARETQHCYADPSTTTLFKREHDTDTGSVTPWEPCSPAEQAAFESAAKSAKDALRKEIKAAEAKKAAEAAKK